MRSISELLAITKAYYAHHFSPCAQCIAAGKNEKLARCDDGRKLWAAYQEQFK